MKLIYNCITIIKQETIVKKWKWKVRTIKKYLEKDFKNSLT